MSEKKYPVKRNGEYIVEIEKLAFGGAGVARIDNYVLFVKGTLPGETARVRISRRKSGYAEAHLLELIKYSPERQNPPCRYHEWCGGCSWQYLDYSKQLKYKEQIVAESLKHIAGLEYVPVFPILQSDTFFGYRNKMEFSFSDRRWLLPEELSDERQKKNFALGLHVPGAFDKILQIDHCMLQSDKANEILAFISDYCQQSGIVPYGIKSHLGFLRFLVIRQSDHTGRLMVNLVTASESPDTIRPLAQSLIQKFPEIESIVNNINSRPAQIAVGEKEVLLAGKPFIQEKLGAYLFNISANSFFQTNTGQAQKMYEKVLEYAALKKGDEVWDLYCGTGTISLFLAEKAGHVTGFELVESAVRDAEKNAAEHGKTNVRFIAGDLVNTMAEVSPRPQVIVCDPPRAGMHEKVVRAMMAVAPRRMVYVSCNPTTLSRDLAILNRDYRIEQVQPIDMFPQTYHIESIALLTRREDEK